MQQHAVIAGQGSGTVSVVSAPAAGSAIVIDSFSLSCGAAASKVTLGFSATNQKVFDLPINGSIPPSMLRWFGDTATALSLTSSTAGPVECTVDYHLEAAPDA